MYKKDGTIDGRYKQGLSKGELRYLLTLRKHDGQNNKAWQELNISRQAGEQYIRSLEKQGFIDGFTITETFPFVKKYNLIKKPLDTMK